MSIAEGTYKRPVTLNERRIEDENIYNSFYYWFKTHSPCDWQEPNGGKNYMSSFPPYCYRFDEFFGFILTLGVNISSLLNKFFPNPDTIDIEYIEEIIFTLDCIVHESKGYKCVKGSNTHIGPASNPHYQANLAEVRIWISVAKGNIEKKKLLEKTLSKAQSVSSQSIIEKVSSPAAKFFLNGFNIDKFTKMLIALDILTESGDPTSNSRPRNWRAVIEALRNHKMLTYNANTTLFEFLKNQYEYPYGIRTIQNPFNIKNLDTQDIYKRANEWCTFNK